MEQEKMPVMLHGKYKGVPIDKLPTSYCRWLLTKDFPEEILKHARRKVGNTQTSDIAIDITRHAYDTFSIRFLDRFVNRDDEAEGIGSFLARKAQLALELGEDVSKARHKDEQLVMLYEDIKYVFNKGGELKILITIMKS